MPKVALKVNGVRREVNIDLQQSLLSVLRETLDLTGTKYGCGEAQCGACTVLVEGVAIRSCVTPAAAVGDQSITTIEGLEQNGRLHPVQQAFLDAGALQCGYCTPGMIMEGVALLRRAPNASEVEIADGMEGHICRCGGYPRIVTALRRAAEAMKGKQG